LPVKISIPWIIGLNQARAFKKKVRQVKVKYGSNQLAKVGAEDGSGYIAFFLYYQHMIICRKIRTIDIHILFLVSL